uniref:FluMu_N domain-containing protein n=1 Tax=Macrostomum lignano TaxID=282301 RepID=A0A1I8HCS6_9PLAT
MSSEQVATVLRQSGEHVRLVVARALQDPADSVAGLEGHPLCQLVPTVELDDHLEQLLAALHPDAEADTDAETLHAGATSEDEAGATAENGQTDADAISDAKVDQPAAAEQVTPKTANNGPTDAVEEPKSSANRIKDDYDNDEEEEVEHFRVELQRGFEGGLGITIAGYVGETALGK